MQTLKIMKKIFALLAATVVIASASIAQTATDTSMHHAKKMMHKSKVMKGDSTMKTKTTKKPA